jgi:hypothetical protein
MRGTARTRISARRTLLTRAKPFASTTIGDPEVLRTEPDLRDDRLHAAPRGRLRGARNADKPCLNAQRRRSGKSRQPSGR